MKKVLVVNIPIRSYIEAYVEIPDGLEDSDSETAQAAVRDAIMRGEFRSKNGSSPDNYELDEAAIEDGWEFMWEAP